MKVLEESEASEYAEFMDNVACTVFRESMKGVVALDDSGVDPRKHSIDIGTAMGQVVLDDIIEFTKDMDKDTLVKWFAEITIASVVGTMVAHPQYKMKIMAKIGLE